MKDVVRLYHGPDGWPDPVQLELEGREWKNCVCGKPLFIVNKTSSKFRLPQGFRSLWPFQGDRGWVVHGTREDTEACQVRVLHFPDYPFINHHYQEAMLLTGRADAVRSFFSLVRIDGRFKEGGLCQVCNQRWYLGYDPVSGRALTVHSDLSAERRCAMLAKITRGARP